MSDYDIVAAGPADIDPIMELEVKAFDPELQASRQTVLDRFALGHHMLVARLRDPGQGGRLVGQISFSFIRFSPDDPSSYPTTFKAHSSQPVLPDANTVCLYSLGVDPADRRVVLFRDLRRRGPGDGAAGGPGARGGRRPTALLQRERPGQGPSRDPPHGRALPGDGRHAVRRRVPPRSRPGHVPAPHRLPLLQAPPRLHPRGHGQRRLAGAPLPGAHAPAAARARARARAAPASRPSSRRRPPPATRRR